MADHPPRGRPPPQRSFQALFPPLLTPRRRRLDWSGQRLLTTLAFRKDDCTPTHDKCNLKTVTPIHYSLLFGIFSLPLGCTNWSILSLLGLFFTGVVDMMLWLGHIISSCCLLVLYPAPPYLWSICVYYLSQHSFEVLFLVRLLFRLFRRLHLQRSLPVLRGCCAFYLRASSGVLLY